MKNITIFLTIMAVGLLPRILCGSEATSVGELMRQAAAHQKVGKFNLAVGALRQALAKAEEIFRQRALEFGLTICNWPAVQN